MKKAAPRLRRRFYIKGINSVKYFTYQWWNDCQRPEMRHEIVRPVEQYEQYYASVKEQLPAGFTDFKKEYSLHDATFLNMSVDVERQEASLCFLILIYTANQSIVQKEGTLIYSGIKFFESSDKEADSMISTSGHGDLGYDEIEVVAQNLYEHRMLFSSGIEFTIRFGDFKFEIEL